MTELEAFNQILALVGLPPVNSAATANNNVAILRDSFSRAKKRILRQAWRKFGVKTDLEANGTGKIPVSSYLRIVYPSNLKQRLTERNGYVWDIKADDYYSDTIKGVWVVSDIAFESISSDSFQEFIALEAAAEVSMRLSDVDANYVEINRLRNQARRQAYNEARVSLDGTFDIPRATRGFYE
ncbi:MAG: hypothetical protein ACF8K1_05320 [Phycisphaerales bacterium JB047]